MNPSNSNATEEKGDTVMESDGSSALPHQVIDSDEAPATAYVDDPEEPYGNEVAVPGGLMDTPEKSWWCTASFQSTPWLTNGRLLTGFLFFVVAVSSVAVATSFTTKSDLPSLTAQNTSPSPAEPNDSTQRIHTVSVLSTLGIKVLASFQECQYEGIVCDKNDTVTGINLESRNLTGSIISNIGELTQLETLNLANNFLIGTVPTQLGTLQSLRSVNIAGNKLKGEISFLCHIEAVSYDAGEVYRNCTEAPSTIPSLLPSSSPSSIPSLSSSPSISLLPSSAPTISSYPTFIQWEMIGNDIDGLEANEELGRCLSLSHDGGRLAVGGLEPVRLYDYHASSDEWILLKDLSSFIVYGASSLSLSSDGTWLIAGDPLAGPGGNSTGSIHVFHQEDGNRTSWNQVGSSLYGENDYDKFGISVAIADDGRQIASGAVFGDYVGIYELVNDEWNCTIIIRGEIESDFGRSISMAGTRLAVGAPWYNDQTGAVYLYDLESGTNNIPLQQIGNDQRRGLGWSVSIAGNGLRLAAGTYSADYVNIYTYNVSVTEFFIQVISSIEGTGGTEFGTSISLSFDGSRLIVGAKWNYEGGADSGRSFMYKINEDGWEMLDEFVGEAAYDESGHAVAISGNGRRAAIGAPSNAEGGEWSGHVRVYEAVGA